MFQHVLLLNMCNILELGGLCVCLGNLLGFLVPGGHKNCLAVVY